VTEEKTEKKKVKVNTSVSDNSFGISATVDAYLPCKIPYGQEKNFSELVGKRLASELLTEKYSTSYELDHLKISLQITKDGKFSNREEVLTMLKDKACFITNIFAYFTGLLDVAGYRNWRTLYDLEVDSNHTS